MREVERCWFPSGELEPQAAVVGQLDDARAAGRPRPPGRRRPRAARRARGSRAAEPPVLRGPLRHPADPRRATAGSTSPALGSSAPARMATSVDFPAPFGPISATTSPAPTSRSSARARRAAVAAGDAAGAQERRHVRHRCPKPLASSVGRRARRKAAMPPGSRLYDHEHDPAHKGKSRPQGGRVGLGRPDPGALASGLSPSRAGGSARSSDPSARRGEVQFESAGHLRYRAADGSARSPRLRRARPSGTRGGTREGARARRAGGARSSSPASASSRLLLTAFGTGGVAARVTISGLPRPTGCCRPGRRDRRSSPSRTRCASTCRSTRAGSPRSATTRRARRASRSSRSGRRRTRASSSASSAASSATSGLGIRYYHARRRRRARRPAASTSGAPRGHRRLRAGRRHRDRDLGPDRQRQGLRRAHRHPALRQPGRRRHAREPRARPGADGRLDRLGRPHEDRTRHRPLARSSSGARRVHAGQRPARPHRGARSQRARRSP